MIKKIIVPTDFSIAAGNALEHAARLAQVFSAQLLLVHVESVAPAAEMIAAGSVVSDNVLLSSRLKELSEEVNRSFSISSDYQVEMTDRSLAETLAGLGNHDTLMVMGTNGIDDVWQFFFGTNTYKVIQQAECPVLLIPEGYSYESYKNILYVFTSEEKGPMAIVPFHEFAKHFESPVTFLHISGIKTDTEDSVPDIYGAVKQEAEQCFDKQTLAFKQIFSDDVPDALDVFITDNPTDLLVMTARHRNIIERLFRKKPALETLSVTTPCPILVFHT
jgi:nucleotide-binding universal stress UspA family protein